jgi:hypothetical protein
LTSSQDIALLLVKHPNYNIHDTLIKILNAGTDETIRIRSSVIDIFSQILSIEYNKVVSIDLLTALIQLLKEDKSELRFHSLKLISNISFHDENCVILSNSSYFLLPTVIDILKDINSDENMIKYCLLTMENLSLF